MSDNLWRIDVPCEDAHIDAFEFALEPFALSVAQYLDDDERCVRLEAYCDVKPPRAGLSDALRAASGRLGIPLPDITITEIANRDWLAEYAEKYPPLKIGRFFVYGSHFEGRPPAGSIALEVDAATAFGSGEHATTKGCLMALEGLSKRYRFRRVLDMGCGSGILGMAAAKLFGCPVLEVDIDPGSVVVAAENAEKNGVGGLVATLCANGFKDPFVQQNAPYELVFANILANPLRAMAKDLAQQTTPGGFAILSGFFHVNANWVFGAYRANGFQLVRRIKVGDWQTLVLRKR